MALGAPQRRTGPRLGWWPFPVAHGRIVESNPNGGPRAPNRS
jgi:hypothetical protein